MRGRHSRPEPTGARLVAMRDAGLSSASLDGADWAIVFAALAYSEQHVSPQSAADIRAVAASLVTQLEVR